MAETFSNANMESLLTMLIEQVKDLPNHEDVREPGDRLDMLLTDLEDVTSELKSCKLDWKTATQQAEERANQLADNHQQLEERMKKMKKEEEQLNRRILELLEREKMFEKSREELEKKEELLQFQPTMIDTLRELTEALSRAQLTVSKAEADAAKAQADAAKAQADSRRTLVNDSVSRFEESLAKRGMGPTSPEKPISKRRRHARQSSVGSAEMLTNVERPEPLPDNILHAVRSPRAQGRTTMFENRQRGNDSSSPIRRPIAATRTPSGGHGLLRTSTGSHNALHSQPSSSMDPANAMGEHSSRGAMIFSGLSGVSATIIPALSEASDEVKRVWRQIEFPANWDTEASNLLLQGFNKNINKKVQAKYRPAGLLDRSSARPNCVLRRLQKVKSPADNGDENQCSECQKTETPCIRASFVSEDLADVEYDPHGQRKRWKLTIREG